LLVYRIMKPPALVLVPWQCQMFFPLFHSQVSGSHLSYL
jgi:hypothetical protein